MPHISNSRYGGKIPMITDRGGERFIADIDRRTTVSYKRFGFESNEGNILLDVDSRARGKISFFADGVKIAQAAVTPSGRSKASLSYKVSEKTEQALSIKFSGKGSFDLYSIEFKE